MSWRDRLRPAKLGAAAILVDAGDGKLGRNVQVHEFAKRDKPYAEDLGRKTRQFTLNAYVIGADYMDARDALIAELESAGAKTLIHPYLGEMKVTVIDADGPRESTRDGGMASFTITVVESGEKNFPAATTDTSLTVAEKAEAATLASVAAFEADFSTLRMPTFVSTSAVDKIKAFADTVRTLTRNVTTIPAAVTGLVNSLTDLAGAASNLVLIPHTLATRVLGIFDQLREAVAAPASALDVVRAMFEFGDDDPAQPSPATEARAQQVLNQQALNNLVQCAAAITAARISAAITFGVLPPTAAGVAPSPVRFASLEDVIELRDELVGVLDVQAERATNDAVYYAVVDVRTAMVADLQQRGALLARIVTVTLPESWPALTIAYEQYEDTALEGDVIARNAIRDPNFAPSGRALEILSNA